MRLHLGPLSAGKPACRAVDGIYSGLRGTDHKLCALVVIGVNARGQKEFLAIQDGVRESTQSWKKGLIGLADRGLTSPKLAVGDGAMGFWAALDEVFSSTARQRCWMHETGNVLNTFTNRLLKKKSEQLFS